MTPFDAKSYAKVNQSYLRAESTHVPLNVNDVLVGIDMATKDLPDPLLVQNAIDLMLKAPELNEIREFAHLTIKRKLHLELTEREMVRLRFLGVVVKKHIEEFENNWK